MTPFLWQEQQFWLTPQRYIFWENNHTLLLSDLHLGKTGHFRKEGIAVPQQAYQYDLHRLFEAITTHKPKQVLIVGDLFHSRANRELDWFTRWRASIPQVHITLVAGNHDLLEPQWYVRQGVEVVDCWNHQHIWFMHNPEDAGKAPHLPPSSALVFGHIHPAISLQGAGRQRLRLPCFYFSGQQCILPAFGAFTGTYSLKPKSGDQIFAITKNELLPLNF